MSMLCSSRSHDEHALFLIVTWEACSVSDGHMMRICCSLLPHYDEYADGHMETMFFTNQHEQVMSSYELRLNHIFVSWRDSPTRFSTLSFFHSSNLPGPLTNGLKYFRLWLRIRWVILNFQSPGLWYPGETISPEYLTPRWAKIIHQNMTPGVSYPSESISPGLSYCTPVSQFF